jgi:hypothetical protein
MQNGACLKTHRQVPIQLILTGMWGRLRDPYPPSPLVPFCVYGLAAARRVTTPLPTRTSVNPVRQLCPEQRPIVIELRAALDNLGLEQHPVLQTPGSQKWEPTCSDALRRSATRSDSSRRSTARSSTQSDGDRQLKRLRTICPPVTLHDRAEPVAVHLDWRSIPVGRMRTTGRVVPDRGEQPVYVQVIAIRRPGFHWRARVYGEFSSRNLSATWSRKRILGRGRDCPGRGCRGRFHRRGGRPGNRSLHSERGQMLPAVHQRLMDGPQVVFSQGRVPQQPQPVDIAGVCRFAPKSVSKEVVKRCTACSLPTTTTSATGVQAWRQSYPATAAHRVSTGLKGLLARVHGSAKKPLPALPMA